MLERRRWWSTPRPGGSGPIRCGSRTAIGFTLPLENPAVHALNRRIAAASGTDVAQGEPLQVLRYRPGGEYKPHFDAIPGFANQRILTMIVWLNEDYEGGETMFTKTGAKLKGRTGDALAVPQRACRTGRAIPTAGHAGLPVTARREADRQPLDPRAPVRAAAKRARRRRIASSLASIAGSRASGAVMIASSRLVSIGEGARVFGRPLRQLDDQPPRGAGIGVEPGEDLRRRRPRRNPRASNRNR